MSISILIRTEKALDTGLEGSDIAVSLRPISKVLNEHRCLIFSRLKAADFVEGYPVVICD